ncbi:hypothetical protein HYH02_004422 [Chlamydomonas schloesseri]|uniref:F5/8 type C domain-containing protein n=1 Tax=Chlamydomonas schloesseri TaxID=2026947 RepID=A0A835WR78_9CHLO|nr:hypothetical protein HYH02_004422 [Chlamydomonas schloesseri]|eukprot:KAG2451155.1 hypothetical protein HYH02_004422 [Chlamydomonas schloesseri]
MYGRLPPGTNLALNKPAYAATAMDSRYPPSEAFDGIKTDDENMYHSNYWSNSDSYWLSVDLGATVNITGIVIYNRPVFEVRLKNAEVRVGNSQVTNPSEALANPNTLVWTVSGVAGISQHVLTLDPPVAGRYVSIRNMNVAAVSGDAVLNLREVEVYGVLPPSPSPPSPAPPSPSPPEPMPPGTNLALNKQAYGAPSFYYGGYLLPSFAVDGTINRDLNCYHSASNVAVDRHWWSVDLGSVVTINGLAIYPRNGYQRRLKNAEVRVGLGPVTSEAEMLATTNALVWTLSGIDGVYPAVKTLATPVIGRYVSIRNMNLGATSDEATLNLAEVEVYGAPLPMPPSPVPTPPTIGAFAS